MPFLKGIVLPYAEKYNIKILEQISSLRFLTVAGNTQPINYECLLDLEELRVEWHSKLELPKSSDKLKTLYIRGYKPNSKNLKDLPHFKNLTELEINQGNLIDLQGVDRLPKLVKGSFFHLRHLQSVASLTELGIEAIHVEGSKIVVDFEELSRCQQLKSLSLIDCGKIKSLTFLEKFRKLEDFRFVNTIVEDGNMIPLLKMKSVGFLKKASYTHTPEEIRKQLKEQSSKSRSDSDT